MRLKNSGFYEWVLPFFEEGAVVESDYISSKVVSSSGIESRVRSIIDANGSVERVIIFNSGVSYNNEDLIQVSPVPIPFVEPANFTAPLIQANVDEAGSLIDATIMDGGSVLMNPKQQKYSSKSRTL